MRRYVREKRALSLEEMVRKVTSFPAGRLGLVRRGLLKEDMYADVLAFDPDGITDRATFASPCQYSEGIVWAIVNGVVVIDGGDHTGAKPGRVLLRGRI